MGEFIGLWEGFAIGRPPPAGEVGSMRGPRRILLNATAADMTLGGEGGGGDIRILDANGNLRIQLDGTGSEDGVIAGTGSTPAPPPPIQIRGDGTIRAGGAAPAGVNGDGSLTLYDRFGRERVTLAATSGDVVLHTAQNRQTVQLRGSEGQNAGLWAGAEQRNGVVVLRDAQGRVRVEMTAADGRITIRDLNDRKRAEIRTDGDVDLFDNDGQVTVKLRSQNEGRAGIWAGGNGLDGFAVMQNSAGNNRIRLDGTDGKVRVYDPNGRQTIVLNGDGGSGWFGGRGQHGDVLLFHADVDDPTSDNASLWLQGSTGDIVLRNADCAEEFEVRLGEEVAAGAVLVLDARGGLSLCTEAYDSCVAGVVSGADGVRPGIVLGRVPGAHNRWPIALAGKVNTNVDASFGPVRIGSLLTTSTRPGYAMVVSDRARAFGAVIGKAMAPLEHGTGCIPVLVGLQ